MDKRSFVSLALTLKRKAVVMKDWENSTVYIRELTALEMNKVSDLAYEMKDGVLQADPLEEMIVILSFCLVDKNDKILFTKKELERMSATHIIELGLVANEINNLESIVDSNEALKKAADNLKKVRSGTSTSSSRKS